MKNFVCFVLALLGLAAVASAQQNQFDGMGDRVFPMVSRLLTDDQRQSVQQIIATQRDQVRSLAEKIRTSRQALLNQVANAKFDEDTVRNYAGQAAKAETDLMVIYARALSQMQPPLSAQQIAQLKNFQPGRFEARRNEADAPTAPEVHLKMPAPLPRDTNDLPVVN